MKILQNIKTESGLKIALTSAAILLATEAEAFEKNQIKPDAPPTEVISILRKEATDFNSKEEIFVATVSVPLPHGSEYLTVSEVGGYGFIGVHTAKKVTDQLQKEIDSIRTALNQTSFETFSSNITFVFHQHPVLGWKQKSTVYNNYGTIPNLTISKPEKILSGPSGNGDCLSAENNSVFIQDTVKGIKIKFEGLSVQVDPGGSWFCKKIASREDQDSYNKARWKLLADSQIKTGKELETAISNFKAEALKFMGFKLEYIPPNISQSDFMMLAINFNKK